MKLSIKAFALAGAITWGRLLFLDTRWLIVTSGISEEPVSLSHVYPGYRLTPLGSLVGLAWAFVDGMIIGAFFAWVYNGLIRKKAGMEG